MKILQSFLRFLASLVGVTAFLIGCANPNAIKPQTINAGASSAGIVGGSEVQAGDPIAQSTILLVTIVPETPGIVKICTGAIISEDTILTAGHCIDPKISNMRVIFTLNAIVDRNVRRPVVGATINPGYLGAGNDGTVSSDLNDMGDIAVVHFSGGLPTGYVPVALLGSDEIGDDPAHAVIAGFGVSVVTVGTEGNPAKSGQMILRKTEIPVVGPLGKTEILFDGSKGPNSCGGDSGGPAFVRVGKAIRLMGLTSRGDAMCAKEAVYTLVAPYKQFITDNMLKP